MTDVSSRIGPVALELPGVPAVSRVARMAASGLASLAGCTVDEIESIKIAVSEVLIALIEHGEGASVRMELELIPNAFRIVGSARIAEFDEHHPDLLLCRTVLDGVCVQHAIDFVDGTARMSADVALTEFA